MPYLYQGARKLEGEKKIGDFECVTLIRHFTKAPWTGSWRQGASVIGNRHLQEGTAIANFVDGKWPRRSHGNHSAFYLGQMSNGIYMIDQWPNMMTKPLIKKRFIYRLGKDVKGNFITPTENADAYFVIE